MSETSPRPTDGAEGATARVRLDSWKEIAAYLKRDATTVRRWEKREGLPVHRHLHERRDSVYAYTAEIDRWWEGRRNQLAGNGALDHPAAADGSGSPTSTTRTWTTRSQLGWALAALFGGATLGMAVLLVARDGTNGGETADTPLRFSIYPPRDTSFGSIAMSPDGRQLAFTTAPVSGSGKSLLWIRSLESLEPRSLPDTEGAAFPFWSPASDALGFFSEGKLWTVDVAGGSPHAVADAPSAHGGTWNRHGIILFAPRWDGGLFQVPAAGGTPAPVTTVAGPDERGHLWPEFLPDGNRFLYVSDPDSTKSEHHNLFVGTLDGAQPRRLLALPSNAAYSSGGYLVFQQERHLVAQRLDAERETLTGEPVVLAGRVQDRMDVSHKSDFSVSANGVLVYRAMQSPATRLIWYDRAQPLAPLVDAAAEYFEPAVSPDGNRVAIALVDPQLSKRFGYGVGGMRSDVWVLDRQTGARSQFTSDPAADWGAVWSPDGRTIVFSSNRRGPLELFHKATTGESQPEQPLTTIGRNPVAQSWSPDGKAVVYAAFDPKTRFDLWLLPMSGDPTPVPLLKTESTETQGQISPDGRWFAYSSDLSGRSEVFVQHFPPRTARWQVSSGGGGDPRWSRDGKELFYLADDRRLMAVAVKPGADFEHGPAVPLFDAGVPPSWYFARNLYDVTRDGRFLFMKPAEDDRSAPITMVVNWLAELHE